MRPGEAVATVALAVALMAASTGFAATMDFESVQVGTLFGGSAGHNPSEVVLTQEGIDMSVENFFLAGFTGFYEAEVGGRYQDFFPTTPLGLNNISVRFDFKNLGFDVDFMTMEFVEFGGEYNFAVNDGMVHQLASLEDIPGNIAPDVIALVSDGTITLEGDINSVRAGGQELAVDTVFAIPEPATLLLLCVGGTAVLRTRRTGRR